MLKRAILLALFVVPLCFACGCIEAEDKLTVYSDGSCLESKVIRLPSFASGKVDPSTVSKAEKDGYEVRFFNKDDVTEIYATKRYGSLEEYCSFVPVSGVLSSGKVKVECTDLNLFVYRRIRLREFVSPAPSEMLEGDELARRLDRLSDSVVSEKRVVTMPYGIVSSNADSVSGCSASWTIDAERRRGEYTREVVCQNVNYFLVTLIVVASVGVLLFLQRRHK